LHRTGERTSSVRVKAKPFGRACRAALTRSRSARTRPFSRCAASGQEENASVPTALHEKMHLYGKLLAIEESRLLYLAANPRQASGK
jgi:hypothetical protein